MTGMQVPKITIVTITFNSESTLGRTIDSVAAQGYPNLEYLIVDGGSTDGTMAIVESATHVVSRWISEPDEGISDAFNKGIALATGEIIGFINSDDQLMPGALDALAKAYEPDIDVYRGKCLFWNEQTGQRSVEVPTLHPSFDGVSKVCHPSTFIAKRAYERYGTYDASSKFVMDLDLLHRFYAEGALFKNVDAVLACFTMGGVTFNSKMDERLAEIHRMMRKNDLSEVQWFRFLATTRAKQVILKVVGRRFIHKMRNESYPEAVEGSGRE